MQTFLHYRWRVPSTLHRLHPRRIIPLLLLALCVTGAKAQSDVKFNGDIRYSKWVIDSRMNDFYANTTPCGFAVYDQSGTQTSTRVNGKDKLDYVVGLVAKSIIEASQYYSQFTWAESFAKPWFLSIKDYGDNFYDKFKTIGGSLDDLNAVKLFIPLRALTETNGKYPDATTYAHTTTALNTALTGLSTHNSSYSIKSGTTAETAGKTVAGGWWHKSDYQDQMWLDGSYMGPALFAELVNYSGTKTNIDATNDWDLIVKQFTILRNMCWNSDDKLLYHAFAADGGTNSTSHSDTWFGLRSTPTPTYCFHSASYWGRAVGWYFLALVDILEQMQKANIASTDSKFITLKGYLEEIAEGIKARQDKTTGGWYQILDKDSKFSASSYNNGKSHTTTNNYIESSATALFTAAYLKAIRLGYLAENDYKTVAVNGYKCLVNNFFSVDENGKVNIFGSCRSAGLGGKGTEYASGNERFRDGSNAYYLLGSDVARVYKSENKTEGKVLGAFIMAATEYERAPENQKAIRFSYDLAPSYTLAQGGSIPAEALGSGTITYQWYKTDGTTSTAVTDATTETTFTPTESGKYYCEAKSGSTTIKTSPTEVTVEGAGNENVESTDVLQVTTNGQTFDLTQTNIENNSYASVSTTTNWVDKTIDKTSYKLYNMSNSDRKITLKVSGASSFEVKVQNSTNGRTYGISVTDANGNTISSSTITHAGTGVESSGIINTNSTGEITIELTGGGSSVYPYQIIFYTGSTEPTGYTITYDLNGHGVAIPENTGATALPDPLPTPETVEGYVFKGWYYDNGTFNNQAKAGDPLTSDVPLYAKWIELYTVTATAENGSIAIKDGNENPVQTNTEVAYGTKLTFTATPNDGYEFTSWSVTGTTGTADGATYTISSLTEATAVTANFTATSTGGEETGNVVTKTGTFPRSDMKTFDGKPDSAQGEVSSISKDADGGTVQTGGVLTLSSESPNVQAQKDDKGTKVRTNGSFTIKAAEGYKIKSIELVTDKSSRNLTSSPDATPERNGTNYTYNFTTGQQSVTFTNNSSGNIYVGVINVTYEYEATSGKTPLTISFSDFQIEGFTGETITLPTPTVKANGTIASSDLYSVTYTSNNKSIAEDPANNQVTLKTAGTVAITAIVEPTTGNTDKYEGGSAVITVVSKAYTPLTVSVADVMMNSNDGAQTNPDVKVYLNNQLVASSNYTVSYQVTSGDNVETTTDSKALTVIGSAGNYTAGTSTIKVTVKPIPAFASTNHCTDGTATFAYVVNQAGTKLQPEIDFPNEITLGIGVTKTLTSYVKYNGVDVTDLFTKNYVITNSVSSSGAEFKNATTGEFYTGTAAATVTIKITATPLPDYADQYEPADKTVTVNIQQLTELTITQPDNMTAKVGEVLDMPSFEITEKTSGAAVSADDLDFVINSSSTSVVTVNGDKLYAVGAGTATIIVLAKDKPGQSKYMDATTSFTVTVEDPTLHIVKNGATATNGQCITDVPGVYMTYGGWVFNSIKTFLGKDYGYKNWKDAGTDDAGAPVGFPYAVKGNGHEDSRDELGASAAPEGKTIDYQSKGFELTDKMFSVPAEGAYFVFTPKVNGTVKAHVLQNGVFDPGYNSSTQQHTPAYKPNRRVFVMDESGTRMPDNQITPHLDVTTGTPKATVTEKHKINGTEFSFTENTKIDDVRAYKTDYENASGKIYLSKDYVFDGGEGSVDGGIEGFKPTITNNKITFQNDIYKRKVNKGKDNVEGGYVVLSKAPVTYTFKVKAGKSYYLYCFGSKLSLYGYEFKADETITEDVVNLSESSSPSLSATPEGHVATVSLDRTFKANIWNACVLPFSLNKYQVDAIFGQTYDKDNPNGTQILYFDRVEGSKIYFVRHAYNHIVAGKPFLIKPTKDNATINTAIIDAFPYVTIEATAQPAAFGKGNDYKWESSYAPFGVEPGDYFLRDTQVNGKPADGNMVRYPAALTTNLSMNGFRGYLKAQTDGVRKSTKSMSIVIGSVDDDETTLIEDVVLDEDGTLRPALKGKVYNIQGQLMTTDASRLNTLPKGIYIINGSKITVE